MNLHLRAAILWIVIVFCYFIHGYYHLAELFFGMDIKIPDAQGHVPVATHLFSVFVEILPLSIGVATLFISGKWFVWTAFVFSILFALLNLVHLAMTIFKEAGDIRQIALLGLIMVVNILLVSDISKQRKRIKNVF